MADNLISVTQFSTYVKRIFDAEEMLKNIAVFGEISGFKVSGGNAYFSVKDAGAMLQCVKFGIAGGAYVPKDGDMVIVRGSPNYYVQGGRFSFNVYKIEPYGQGVLFAQMLELKNKLEAEGLFSPEKKMALPKYVKRIGVVTSETGAVIRDIIDVATRRNKLVDIVLFPAKVQGVGADAEVVEGIHELNKINVDVIIVARGGGSVEDLSPFNTEIVARAIADSKKPVVSAVGHETDFTIADFVADVRAPTPSAAAELVVYDLQEELNKISALVKRIQSASVNYVNGLMLQTETHIRRLSGGLREILQAQTMRLRENVLCLNSAVNQACNNYSNNLKLLWHRLDALNPNKLLCAGYARVLKNDKCINSLKQIDVGDVLGVIMFDGKLNVKVENKEEK